MFPIPEQLSQAAKTQLETQLNILNNFANKAFEGAQKVIALNVSTARASVEQGSDAVQQLLASKDPKEFISLSAAQAPSLDKVLAYGRELFSIASQTQAELLQTAKDQLGAARSAGVAVQPPLLNAPAAVAEPAALVVETAQTAADPVAVSAAAAAAPADTLAKPPKAKPVAAAKAVSEAVAAVPVSARAKK
jgi:phasin family protein